MTSPELPPLHRDLVFHGPLSDQRAAQLVHSLGPLAGRHVVDLGCGWAELLLRTLAAEPAATGFGIDLDEEDIRRARANAEGRGLADRVDLEVGDVGAWQGEPTDVVFNIGASHVWGGEPVTHTANALTALADLVRPGGKALLGECFWRRTPSEEEYAVMEGTRGQYRPLPELVDFALSHGFRLYSLSEATVAEWDVMENGVLRGREDWLLANPDAPGADAVRERADRMRRFRLHGARETIGFAYLTLLRA
ncbi:SAM-dependent methyltransferase [Nocardiopsis ganjiahuensis]|uniref:SAM-dependent methyltransferase n=1 Tax=Nocardiopsis ganjiahuensis TaxID=239984 RepID=UPI0003458661|nr:class I SAM-dependent methyltransferase [Nocardiopsis ganjiahuensis]